VQPNPSRVALHACVVINPHVDAFALTQPTPAPAHQGNVGVAAMQAEVAFGSAGTAKQEAM